MTQEGQHVNGIIEQYPASFSITPNWKLSLFGLLFLPLFISLGFWQLDRAEEKQKIREAFYKQQALTPVSFSQYDASQPFQAVSLKGHFDSQQFWMLENQVYQGRNGYRVIVPFYLEASTATKEPSAVLVDLDWVAAPSTRDYLPEVSFQATRKTLVGFITQPGDNPLLSYSSERVTGEWPRRIVEIDIEAMAEEKGTVLFDGLLKLDRQQPPLNTTPEKHQGYAVQWFAMAVALLLALLIANTNLVAVIKGERQ